MPTDYYAVENGKAIIPVKGMLCGQVNVCSAFFGEEVTTYGFIQRAVQQADLDPMVKEIYLDVDSGGGYVSGVEETSAVIKGAKKPTTALVGSMSASAAYWLASACDSVVATQRTGFLGSIGVVVETIDRSKADEAQGYTRLVITNQQSKDKRPNLTTDEGKSVLLQELDDIYGEFKLAILDKRSKVLSSDSIDALSGRVIIAEKALSYGLVDKLESRNDLINGVTSVKLNINGSSACADDNKNGGKSMNLQDFLASSPEAQAEYDTALANAEKAGIEKAEADKAEYQANVLEIVELSGGTLNKVALASIKNGDTPAEFALAEIKSHKASGKTNEVNAVKPKTEIVTEAKSETSAVDDYYAKRREALKKQGKVK